MSNIRDEQIITFRATLDERDAPIYIYTLADGSQQFRRDDNEPGEEWNSKMYMPHGNVYINGYLSQFDKKRREGGT